MTRAIHPVAGVLALLTIMSFWVPTAVTEALGSTAAIVAVKTWIPWGFVVLIPALMAAGRSGFALSRGRQGGLVEAKRKAHANNRSERHARSDTVGLVPRLESGFGRVRHDVLRRAGDRVGWRDEHRSARPEHA